MEIKEQELTEIKSQVSIMQGVALSLKIESKEDMNKATDALYNIRQGEKYIEEKKTNITRPLMSSLAQIRDLFKPLETSLKEANKIIKEKMLAYQIVEDDRIEKEKARIAARVEKGTMRADTAVSKLEDLGDSGQASKGEVGKSSIRTVKKVRIVDETAIPREYLVPNMILIADAVIKKGLSVSGVEIYEEKSIVSR